jgi:hypothetical protein
VKLVTKFIKKMINHIDDNLVPKVIPQFSKNFFVKQGSGKILLCIPTTMPTRNPNLLLLLTKVSANTIKLSLAPKRRLRRLPTRA